MLFWKIALKQFRSSSWYTLPSTHNFCEGPQPQGLNTAIFRPKILRPCYIWGSVGMSASIILPLLLLHVYVCFAVIFEEPLIKRNKENKWNEEDISYCRFGL